MSFGTWWEERKRRQEEREASRYGFDEGAAEDGVWVDPEEESEEAGTEIRDAPVAESPWEEAPAEEAEAEEPQETAEPEPEPEPVVQAAEPQVYEESWWKRRLLGAGRATEEPAPDEPRATAPEEEEPVADESVFDEPVVEEEPVAEEPIPEEPLAEEPLEEEPVVEEEPVAEEPLEEEPVYAFDDEADVLEEEAVSPEYLDDEDLLEDEVAVEPVVDEDASPTPVSMDVPGPRRARLEGERRHRRRKELARGFIAAAVATAVGAAGLVSILSRDEAPAPPPGTVASGARVKDTITTTLVFGTKEQRSSEAPTWIALLSVDTATGRCSVVYIPAHTATGVPGRGLLAIGESLESGGVPLLLLAAETLLGTPVDRYLELSDADAEILFGETGPLTVEVPDDVRVSAGPGQARLLFTAGPQRLDPRFLVDLLYVKGLETDDVELGGRHLAFWSSLFEAFAFDADGLGAAVKSAGAAVGESDSSPGELARLFETLAAADSGDRRLALLPVRQMGVGGSELYQVDQQEVKQFLTDTVGAQAVAGREVRIQILNGNGAPGVGQDVAERLGDEGFRVILSGNARRLNYRETLVIAYERSPEALELARKTRDLIGVGEVQIAAQSQGIVDLTIVVGKDFLQTL